MFAKSQAEKSVSRQQRPPQRALRLDRAARDDAAQLILRDENLSASQSRNAAVHPPLSGRAGVDENPATPRSQSRRVPRPAPRASSAVCSRHSRAARLVAAPDALQARADRNTA